MIRNYERELRRLQQDFGPLDSRERCGLFTELAAGFLHEQDRNFGHLKKPEERTNYRGHGLDVVLYKATGQVVDIIGAAKIASREHPASVTWGVGEEGEYGVGDWIDPDDVHTPTKPEDKKPEQGASGPKHSYDDQMKMVKACGEAFGGNLPDDFTSHLIWRFQFEGYSFEALVKEARSRR
jgi:hypothetical protein